MDDENDEEIVEVKVGSDNEAGNDEEDCNADEDTPSEYDEDD